VNYRVRLLLNVAVITVTRGAEVSTDITALPSRAIIEVERDEVVFNRQTILVGVGVIIGTGGQINHDGLCLNDVLDRMIDASRDDQDGSIAVAKGENV
jgi:hypothetical protein